ncbi:DNA adenine methylase [bacterium]|jgi:DNA adenine methylase|nr:DNA adenine methylase [bacterium]
MKENKEKIKPLKRTGLHSYFGGKNCMNSFIVPYVPKDTKIFVEPFSGSFAIYFYSTLSENAISVYNDQNKDQVNLFACSKNYNKFLDVINKHFNDDGGLLNPGDVDPKIFYKELYYKIKKSDFPTTDFDVPDYDRASMYAFMLHSAFSSINYQSAGYSGFNKERLKLLTFVNKLNNEYVRMKLDKITYIENMDFEELIKKYDSSDTFFYLDPPYNSEEKIDDEWVKDDERRVGWYSSKNTFTKDSHERLAKCLKTIKGKFALSYYDFENLSIWFPKDKYIWKSQSFFRSSASFSDNKDKKGTELLIMNYKLSDEEIEENKKLLGDQKVVKKKPIVTTLEEFKKMDDIVVEKENIIEKVTPKKETDDFWD